MLLLPPSSFPFSSLFTSSSSDDGGFNKSTNPSPPDDSLLKSTRNFFLFSSLILLVRSSKLISSSELLSSIDFCFISLVSFNFKYFASSSFSLRSSSNFFSSGPNKSSKSANVVETSKFIIGTLIGFKDSISFSSSSLLFFFENSVSSALSFVDVDVVFSAFSSSFSPFSSSSVSFSPPPPKRFPSHPFRATILLVLLLPKLVFVAFENDDLCLFSSSFAVKVIEDDEERHETATRIPFDFDDGDGVHVLLIQLKLFLLPSRKPLPSSR
mmetsp:Transcript_5804/g.19461  ORF Transcript_5804/g.19461 Transcript_5804/m.19461 type:complete len:269 (+) Transcript_5804:1746-2552(+)